MKSFRADIDEAIFSAVAVHQKLTQLSRRIFLLDFVLDSAHDYAAEKFGGMPISDGWGIRFEQEPEDDNGKAARQQGQVFYGRGCHRPFLHVHPRSHACTSASA